MKKNILFYFLFSMMFVRFLTPLRAADEELHYAGVSYVCTGVGESKEDPRWKIYPLKLMFTGSRRAYVSEVKIEIKEASGKIVLKTDCDGPWLLVKLKAGKYSVWASAEGGSSQTITVRVPETGQNELAIRFSGIPE